MTQLSSARHNIHQHCKKTERVQADLDQEVYDYFFSHVFAGMHGARQALINYFFQRLYEECFEQNIRGKWDEDDAYGNRVVTILNKLNFKDNGNDRPVQS